MSYQTIAVEPLTPHIGAEISNIDLSQPLSDQAIEVVRDAVRKHLVVFFRDQEITPEQHIAFARRFGELNVHPFVPSVEGHPELLLLRNDRDNPPEVNKWHSDVTFMERPADGAILRAVELPEVGGDTMWASMYAAYDALSDNMQRFLSGLTAIHDFEHIFFGNQVIQYNHGSKDPKERAEKLALSRERYPVMEHPVVRTHPRTGRRALFVNSIFTVAIKDMKQSESRALLDFLYQHVSTPEFQVRFKWRKNSIAFWDNRWTQHYALADYWPQTRVMYRATLQGSSRPS